MALNLTDLERVRGEMLEELKSDLSQGTLYISPRLSEAGTSQYPDLLKEAITQHDEDWLAAEIRSRSLLQTHEVRHTKRGRVEAKIPVTAPETLAEGEFNRFYVRGVCCSSLAGGETEVEVYRAKPVSNPRPESQRKVGSRVAAESLLDDLRTRPGVDTALGVPAGPNSGLSVRRAH